MFRNLMNYAAKRPKPEDLVKKWKIVKGDTVRTAPHRFERLMRAGATDPGKR